jgi:hypothetical protein
MAPAASDRGDIEQQDFRRGCKKCFAGGVAPVSRLTRSAAQPISMRTGLIAALLATSFTVTVPVWGQGSGSGIGREAAARAGSAAAARREATGRMEPQGRPSPALPTRLPVRTASMTKNPSPLPLKLILRRARPRMVNLNQAPPRPSC